MHNNYRDFETEYQIKVLEDEIVELTKDLSRASRQLIIEYDENKDRLGIHDERIKQLLEFLALNPRLDGNKMKMLIKRFRLQSRIFEKYSYSTLTYLYNHDTMSKK